MQIERYSELLESFSHWLRFNPPVALSFSDWKRFKEKFRKEAPIRYFLVKTVPKYTTHVVIRTCRRIGDKFHKVFHSDVKIKTGIPYGVYGTSEVLLHANFNILAKHVEEVEARAQYNRLKKDHPFKERLPFYWTFNKFSRPELTLARLRENIEAYKNDIGDYEFNMCHAAKEIIELYTWWTVTRPARVKKEPRKFDRQGLGTLATLLDEFDDTAEDYQAYRRDMEDVFNQEQEWKEEDRIMLFRLILIRDHLWL